ncbi:MAG: transcriptional regulator [Planctomycetaceae bacterium]|nr:transcriptional regulator [Planctomycetaceae bacterium]
MRSPCPICAALDLVGDKWSLLIVRDMIWLGKTRYNQFTDSPEHIPTNILADRLKRMERFGLIQSKPYQDNPPRHEYHLTDKGLELRPVLIEMIHWANKHIPGTITPPVPID